ncbi:MAG: Rne/Rng family ribonuclease [Candidatus Melainabacteria bacterium]|nr:Rne/Rng family ribonuclease [Candidatus Melainabacteria bacterium]
MANRKVIISERDNIAALFEGDRAIEFLIHRGDMLLGDVYLATVENILPSIDAGFVNVGGDKMGFLHSSDVQGKGDLKKRLEPKQKLVVQVMKEPTGHKGPRVTTNISLPGRFLVMMPQSKGISISRKIEQQAERSRLKSAVSLIKPPGLGVIIRTEAEGQKDSDVQEDFETLMERWQNIVAMADTAEPPALLYRDQDLLYRVIRETVTEDVDEIVVDTSFGFQRAQQLLQNWNLDKTIKVSQYTGNQSIMIAKGVDREIRQALQTKVPLPSGGYLYIQPTEALTVVDVNSGKFTSLQSQAETIRITNLEATKEIARQLRLRNIGGMIVVDFIDMESRADQLAILQAFENELAPDKAKPQVGQLTDLGLVEMTRHRQGQSLSEIFTKKCSACHGTGLSLDEFHWASPGMEGDFKSLPPGARHKLPLRQVRPNNYRNQGSNATTGGRSQGPGGGQHGGGGKGGRFNNPQQGGGGARNNERGQGNDHRRSEREGAPSATNLSVSNVMALLKQPATLTLSSALGGNANPEHGLTRPASLNLKKLAELPVVEYFKERLSHALDMRFSNSVKVAITPDGANGHLSRMNPKANDIMTLVKAIEDTGMPGDHSPVDLDDEEDSAAEEGHETTEGLLVEESAEDEAAEWSSEISDEAGQASDVFAAEEADTPVTDEDEHSDRDTAVDLEEDTAPMTAARPTPVARSSSAMGSAVDRALSATAASGALVIPSMASSLAVRSTPPSDTGIPVGRSGRSTGFRTARTLSQRPSTTDAFSDDATQTATALEDKEAALSPEEEAFHLTQAEATDLEADLSADAHLENEMEEELETEVEPDIEADGEEETAIAKPKAKRATSSRVGGSRTAGKKPAAKRAPRKPSAAVASETTVD